MGLTLEALSAHTVDEAGREAFVTQDPLKLLRKVRDLVSVFGITSCHGAVGRTLCSLCAARLLEVVRFLGCRHE